MRLLPELQILLQFPVAVQFSRSFFVLLIEFPLIDFFRLQQFIHRNPEEPGNFRQQLNVRISVFVFPFTDSLKGYVQILRQLFLRYVFFSAKTFQFFTQMYIHTNTFFFVFLQLHLQYIENPPLKQ